MAILTWRGSVDSNWGNASNWLGGAIPTLSDSVIFDNISPTCSLNVLGTASSIDFASYSNTITMANGITVYGNVTLGASMGITGSGTLTIASFSTLTSNGKQWGRPLNISTTGITLSGNDWYVTNFTLPNSSTSTINGFQINISGNLSVTNTGGSTGSTKLAMIGTGTWSHSSSGVIRNDLEFNTTGTVSVSGSVYWGGPSKTLKYTANTGTVSTSGSTLITNTVDTNYNFDTGVLMWNNIDFNFSGGTRTYTLVSNLNIGGLLRVGTFLTYIAGNFSINCYGGLFITAPSGGSYLAMNAGSSPTLNLLGGTWSHNGTSVLRMNTNINGNIGVSGSVTYDNATMSYIGGTPSVSGSTLTFGNATTINTSGVTWSNVLFQSGANITLIGNLNVGATLSNSGNTIINGTYTINTNGLSVAGYMVSTVGQASINLTGGSWTAVDSNSDVRLPLQLNGNISVVGTVYYQLKTLSWTGVGTVTTTGSTLNIIGSATLDVAGITWWNFSFGGGNTITNITGDLNIGNNLITVTGNTTKTINGSGNINVSGSFLPAYRAGIVKGTGSGYTLRMIGKGSILDSELGSGSGTLLHSTLDGVNLIIDTSQTINFATSNPINTPYFGIRNSNFTYLNGTVSVASGHVFDVNFSSINCVLDTKGSTTSTTSLTSSAGINWNIFRFNGGTLILNSPLCIVDSHFGSQVSTINGSTIYNNGSLSFSSQSLGGTTIYRLVGTGTWSGAGYINSDNFIVDSAGTVTISGNVYRGTGTFSYLSGTVSTGTSTLNLMGSQVLNTGTSTTQHPNGIPWNNVTISSSAPTITLLSNLRVNGLFLITPNVSATLNGAFSYDCYGGVTQTVNTLAAGNSQIGLYSGTWTTLAAGVITRNRVNIYGDINIVGTVSFTDIRYYSGSVTTSNSTLGLYNSIYIETGGVTWSNAFVGNAITITTGANFNIGGLFNVANNITVSGNYSINCIGGLLIPFNISQQSGTTTTMNIIGGTWSGSGTLPLSTNIGGTGSTLSLAGTLNFSGTSLNYTGYGTVSAGTSSLVLNSSANLNIGGINWNLVRIGSGVSSTFTFSSGLVSNILETRFDSNSTSILTLTGSGGFTTGTFSNATSSVAFTTNNRTIVFQPSPTYTINNNLTFTASSAAKFVFQSSSATNRSIFTLNPAATQNMSYVNGTRMDSSGGQTIYSQNAVLVDNINWSIYDPSVVGNFLLMF